MRLRSFAALGVLLLACTACGKSAPEPETPPADSTNEPAAAEPVVAASSDAVKKGRDQIQAEDFAGAEETLGAAAKADPKDPQAAFYHGVALEALERLDECEAEYRRAIELSPELLEAHVNLSYLLLSLDHREKDALAAADAGLAVDPKAPELLANRAGVLDLLNDPRQFEAYDAAIAADPDNAQVRFNYAQLLAASERKDDAVKALGGIRLQSVSDVEVLLRVGDLFGRLGAFASCVEAFDVVAGRKKTAEILARRAVCKHGAGDDQGAEADLREAVQLEPESPIGHYYLGKHLLTVGKKADGKASLKKAVSLGPQTSFGKAAASELSKLK